MSFVSISPQNINFRKEHLGDYLKVLAIRNHVMTKSEKEQSGNIQV